MTPLSKALSNDELVLLFEQHIPHGRDIGLRLDDLSVDGKVRMSVLAEDFLAGDREARLFFPGVLFSLADSACGLAVLRALARFVPIATLDMRIDHLSPATMDANLLAVAECYRHTSTIAFARCEVLSGPAQQVTAIAVGTFMLSSSSPKAQGVEMLAGLQET